MSEDLMRLARRMLSSVLRGRVSASDDSGPVQLLQIKINDLETVDNIPRVMEFGFTSRPPENSDVLAPFIGGDRSNATVLGTNHGASRPKLLQEGETVLFNQVGIKIYLSKAGLVIEGAGLPIVVNNAPVVTINASTKVQLNTPTLAVSGAIQAGGDITDNAATNASTMANMRQVYDDHNHPVKNVQGGLSAITSDKPNQQV